MNNFLNRKWRVQEWQRFGSQDLAVLLVAFGNALPNSMLAPLLGGEPFLSPDIPDRLAIRIHGAGANDRTLWNSLHKRPMVFKLDPH